jgi:2'-5' RNA ligase
MTRERLKSPRARLFVALDLPGPVRDELALWGERALNDPALRPVSRDSLHLTLCFLGYLPEKRIPDVAAVVAGVAPHAVPITLQTVPVAKPPGRPRFFAIDVEAPAAIELQAELQGALVAADLYEPEKRPFWPHLTVARVRSERGGGRRPRRVEKPPGELPPALAHTFGSVRLALYRSNLRPEGAQYVSLASLDLPPVA